MEKLQSMEQFNKLKNEERTMFMFSADWCSDCRVIEPLLPGIEADYPEYSFILVDRDEFINIAKVSSLFARESAGSITIKADEGASEISITSIASQLGENTSSAAAKVSGGGEVTLNSRYLLDVLNVLSAEQVTFSFNGKLEPCILTDNESTDRTYLIMPLKS